ncbi:MAG TPA: glycosyltransferase, partial [Thiobacillaceae bacterium]|nr:glycosyltransferase [Thiobacillaceae bacterium]
NEVNSPWVQIATNWRAAPGPEDIASTVAAQSSISCIWAADSADAGLFNNFSRVASQVNLADANFNAAQWPDNGNNVAWGDIFGYRCVPYSGAWNLPVLSDVVSGATPFARSMSGPKLSRAMLLLAGLGLLLFVAPWRVNSERHAPEGNSNVAGVSPIPDRLSWLFPIPQPAKVKRRLYLPVAGKLGVAHLLALTWLVFSIHVALPWLHDLSTLIPAWFAILVTTGIAFLPGYVFAFVFVSLLLDRRPPASFSSEPPPLSILVAAYNEEDTIAETLNSIIHQGYPAPVEIILVDDGSRDRTVEIAQGLDIKELRIHRMGKNGGKARALNAALTLATHSLVVTIDADTHLYKDALQRLVARYLSDPPGTVAVAGAIHVRNSRDNWLTKIQEWDYFHGIAVIKRVQSLYQGVLVAQGAFSLYTRQALQDAGGWPECVGEDIVLTWDLMEKGHRVGYAEDAVVFTRVPTTFRQYYQQRKRWARGLIEAFKHHPKVLTTPRLNSTFFYLNLLYPFIDASYLLFFLPGVIAALLGYYYLAGIMTLMLIPLGLLNNLVMLAIQKRMFKSRNLSVRRNFLGLLAYMVFGQLVMAPASVMGYVSEFISLRKTWGTK